MLGDWLLPNSHGNLSPLWLSEACVSVPEHRCRAEANIVWELFAWVFWSGLECMRTLWLWLWFSQSPRTVKDEKDCTMYYTAYACIISKCKKKKNTSTTYIEIAWLLFYIEEARSWVRLNLLSRVTCTMAEPQCSIPGLFGKTELPLLLLYLVFRFLVVLAWSSEVLTCNKANLCKGGRCWDHFTSASVLQWGKKHHPHPH